MTRKSDLHSLLKPPDIYGILGIPSAAMAMFGTSSGRIGTWGYGWLYRSQNPVSFWFAVAIDYLIVTHFLCVFFYAAQ
jgi:hypothetical protein